MGRGLVDYPLASRARALGLCHYQHVGTVREKPVRTTQGRRRASEEPRLLPYLNQRRCLQSSWAPSPRYTKPTDKRNTQKPAETRARSLEERGETNGLRMLKQPELATRGGGEEEKSRLVWKVEAVKSGWEQEPIISSPPRFTVATGHVDIAKCNCCYWARFPGSVCLQTCQESFLFFPSRKHRKTLLLTESRADASQKHRRRNRTF